MYHQYAALEKDSYTLTHSQTDKRSFQPARRVVAVTKEDYQLFQFAEGTKNTLHIVTSTMSGCRVLQCRMFHHGKCPDNECSLAGCKIDITLLRRNNMLCSRRERHGI